MFVNFETVLVGLDKKPLLSENGASLLLGDVVANALVSQYSDETPSGIDKVKRWTLATRVHAGIDVGLTADDITLIKNLVAKAYGPIVVGQVWATIDPESVK